jgi:hypothetical protein
MENTIILLIIVFILFSLGLTLAFFAGIEYKNRCKTKKKKVALNKYRCLDGHLVRSKGELIIDNYLYFLGISHIYERILILWGNKIKCDWFLPKYDLYIEYWGYTGKKYLERKEEKLRLYRKAKLELISIENWMFIDLYSNINKVLEKYVSLHQERYWKPRKKFCTNCGSELDERF